MVAVALTVAPAAWAVKVPGLYEADVPVADQSTDSRKDAVASALRVVLVKVTGNSHVADNLSVEPIIGRADKYVQQYLYHEAPVAGADAASSGETELRIRVRFDPDALDHDLRDLGAAVWGSERPLTLVWIVYGNGSQRDWLSMDSYPEYAADLKRQAESRGVPIIFPLFDLQDTASVKPSDVWGGFSRPVVDASQRYHPDTILVGTLESAAPGVWQGHWTAFLGDETSSWSSEGDMAESVLDDGVDGLADFLAGHYVQQDVSAELGTMQLVVSGIDNVNQYAHVLKYLGSLNSVATVHVVKVEPGTVTFALDIHGGETAVSQAIALGQTLESAGGAVNQYKLVQ